MIRKSNLKYVLINKDKAMARSKHLSNIVFIRSVEATDVIRLNNEMRHRVETLF